jgi:photosystem II stability/assembly factor-like uncharacterized protein
MAVWVVVWMVLAVAGLWAQGVPAALFSDMKWRLIGPFRGGRAAAVSGVPGDGTTYFFGSVDGGVWKTANAGVTWEPLFDGQPIASIGALAVAPSNPQVIYAGTGESDIRSDLASGDGVYKSVDAGKTWRWMNDADVRPFYYSQVRVSPANPDHVFWSSTPLKFSRDGGKTAGNTTVNVHVDHHAMWIDPKDPSHIIVGDDGGVAQSWDNGGNWTSLNSLAIGQYYNVSVDNAVPYNVCGGAQDNESQCGPSHTL